MRDISYADDKHYLAFFVSSKELDKEDNENILNEIGAKNIHYLRTLEGFTCYMHYTEVNKLTSKFDKVRDINNPSSPQCT